MESREKREREREWERGIQIYIILYLHAITKERTQSQKSTQKRFPGNGNCSAPPWIDSCPRRSPVLGVYSRRLSTVALPPLRVFSCPTFPTPNSTEETNTTFWFSKSKKWPVVCRTGTFVTILHNSYTPVINHKTIDIWQNIS